MTDTRVYLVRHGETDGNVQGRSQGRRDVPLNERGREQARAIGAALASAPIVALASSPSVRARDTAKEIARPHGLSVAVDPRLGELDQGELDGLTVQEMAARFPEVLARWGREDPAEVRLPGGETMGEAQARMIAAIEDLAARSPGQAIAVVSHNLALKSLLCHALRVPLAGFRSLQTDVASVSIVDVRAKTPWTVIGINDCCHLH